MDRLALGQYRALAGVAARELTWIVPSVSRELVAWRQRAAAIPDESLRRDALLTLAHERLNADGAALLAAVPRRRCPALLSLIVAFQLILDYLDTVGERPARDPLASGAQLHRALVEAVDARQPICDHYRHLGCAGDGGYLRALVERCRAASERLPGFPTVAPLAIRHARRLAVQVLNHDPDPARREAAIRAWAGREFPGHDAVTAYELAAGCSSTLAIHALFAVAAEPRARAPHIAAVDAAYFPWVNAASTLLDSFVDGPEDLATGAHNYLTYYESRQHAADRLAEIVFQSVHRARQLPRGHRHALIASGMVAMYLSHDAARSPELREHTLAISRAAGSLQLVQLPIMRIFRRVHGLRNA